MSDARLYIASTALAFSDQSALPSQNPSSRYFDWEVTRTIDVNNPEGGKEYLVQPGQTLSVFSGARTTAIDGTTQFAVALNGLASAYRFTFAAGTAPALKTDRALTLHGETLTLAANLNGTLSVTSTIVNGPSPLAALQSGDVVFIPGLTTGDVAGPFSPINEGAWLVLAATATTAILQRTYGTNFSGTSEAVAVATDAQVLGYADDKVLVGDHVDVTAGFVLQTRRTYVVTAVTPKWFEVVSTLVIPAEQKAPGATGLQFYGTVKRWMRIEVDQEASVQFNGDNGTTNRISPFVSGDLNGRGYLEKWGSVYALSLVNRSAYQMKAIVWSVE